MCGGMKDKNLNVLARHQALWLSSEAGNRVNSFHGDLKALKKEASLLLSKLVLIVSGNIPLKHYNCVRSLNLRAAADARMQTSPRGTWNVQTWGSSLRKQRAEFIFLVFFNSFKKKKLLLPQLSLINYHLKGVDAQARSQSEGVMPQLKEKNSSKHSAAHRGFFFLRTCMQMCLTVDPLNFIFMSNIY